MSDVVTLLIVALVCAATARLTRLITDDRISLPLRQTVINRFGPDHALSYLVLCPWCVSPYVATGLSVPAVFWGLDVLPWHVRIILTCLLIPSASYVAGILSGKE